MSFQRRSFAATRRAPGPSRRQRDLDARLPAIAKTTQLYIRQSSDWDTPPVSPEAPPGIPEISQPLWIPSLILGGSADDGTWCRASPAATTIPLGGLLEMNSGGKAVSSTIFSGGTQIISRGGLASGALVDSSRSRKMLLRGRRTDATLTGNSDFQNVDSRATTIDTGDQERRPRRRSTVWRSAPPSTPPARNVSFSRARRAAARNQAAESIYQSWRDGNRHRGCCQRRSASASVSIPPALRSAQYLVAAVSSSFPQARRPARSSARAALAKSSAAAL